MNNAVRENDINTPVTGSAESDIMVYGHIRQMMMRIDPASFSTRDAKRLKTVLPTLATDLDELREKDALVTTTACLRTAIVINAILRTYSFKGDPNPVRKITAVIFGEAEYDTLNEWQREWFFFMSAEIRRTECILRCWSASRCAHCGHRTSKDGLRCRICNRWIMTERTEAGA